MRAIIINSIVDVWQLRVLVMLLIKLNKAVVQLLKILHI